MAPIYEYEREDGTFFELIQKIEEDALTICPTTGQKVKRLISAPNSHFKGSGFYCTDYKPCKIKDGNKKNEVSLDKKVDKNQ